jgi:hypothetical protein
MVGDYSILISIYEIPIIRTQPATLRPWRKILSAADLPFLTCPWLALTVYGPHHIGDPPVNDPQVRLDKLENLNRKILWEGGRPCGPATIWRSHPFRSPAPFKPGKNKSQIKSITNMHPSRYSPKWSQTMPFLAVLYAFVQLFWLLGWISTISISISTTYKRANLAGKSHLNRPYDLIKWTGTSRSPPPSRPNRQLRAAPCAHLLKVGSRSRIDVCMRTSSHPCPWPGVRASASDLPLRGGHDVGQDMLSLMRCST